MSDLTLNTSGLDSLRQEWDRLLVAIKELPEPERTLLLREVRARAAAAIETPKRSAASVANMTRINETRREYGVSAETRARLSAAQKAAWARKKAQTENSEASGSSESVRYE